MRETVKSALKRGSLERKQRQLQPRPRRLIAAGAPGGSSDQAGRSPTRWCRTVHGTASAQLTVSSARKDNHGRRSGRGDIAGGNILISPRGGASRVTLGGP